MSTYPGNMATEAGKVSQAPPAYPTNPNQNPAYGQNPAYPSQPYPSAAPAGAYPSAALTGAYPSAALAGPYPVQGQQYAVEVHQPTFATSQVVVTNQPQEPDCLVWSILSCIFCCCITGIIAIVFSAMARQSYARGDINDGASKARVARALNISGLTLGLLYIVPLMIYGIWFAAVVAPVISSVSSCYYYTDSYYNYYTYSTYYHTNSYC